MSLSATISLDQSTIGYNQQSHANVTITNSGSNAVNLTFMQPHLKTNNSDPIQNNINGQFSAPTINAINGPVYTIPGSSGTLVVPFSYVLFSPQVAKNGQPSQSVPTQYKVGCLCQTSDGSQFAPTDATLTILPIAAN